MFIAPSRVDSADGRIETSRSKTSLLAGRVDYRQVAGRTTVTHTGLGRRYCDHQENRKSVTGREHLRVPSGVPLPASGLSAASGLILESTQRGTTASQRAECSK